MQNRKEKIKSMLLMEVYEKSLTAAIVFSSYAMFAYFYGFGIVRYRTVLNIACAGVIVASILRYLESKKLNSKTYSSHYWNKMRFPVWLNAVCWSSIFAITALEHDAITFHYVIAMVFMSTFLTGSLLTLSYDKWLFFPFQVILLTPTMIICFFQGQKDSNFYILAALLLINLLYHVAVYTEYKRQLLNRFNTQADLEVSYSAFKEKTAQLIQVSKSAALGEMAGGLSHEVNNSLQIILGSLRQLERNLLKKDVIDDNDHKKIKYIATSVEKISGIIDGLRVFSRQMDHGPKEDTLLTNVIERSMNYSFEMMKVNNIRLEIQEVPKVVVHCHPIQLTQIIFSLVKNAYDALEKLDSERFIRISFEMHNEKVMVKILNNGPQIPENIKTRLFQPFVTTKDVGEGTGLSLSIAHGIAREHGGNLSFLEKEEFTTFGLELPCQRA